MKLILVTFLIAVLGVIAINIARSGDEAFKKSYARVHTMQAFGCGWYSRNIFDRGRQIIIGRILDVRKIENGHLKWLKVIQLNCTEEAKQRWEFCASAGNRICEGYGLYPPHHVSQKSSPSGGGGSA